jgi:hypothetical protein
MSTCPAEAARWSGVLPSYSDRTALTLAFGIGSVSRYFILDLNAGTTIHKELDSSVMASDAR